MRGEECRGEGVMLRMVEGELVLTVLSRSTHPEEREEEEGGGERGREEEKGERGRERGRGFAYSAWNDAKYLVSAAT